VLTLQKRQVPGHHFNRSELRPYSMTCTKVRIMDELMTSSIPAPEAKACL